MNAYFQWNLRSKLVSILVISLFLGLAAVGTALYFHFKSFLYQGIKDVLKDYADLSAQSFDAHQMALHDSTGLKAFADKTASILGCRLTIIDIDGNVLADSEIPLNKLSLVENHFNRPEVQQSIREGIGFHVRKSATIGRDLMYVSKLLTDNGNRIGFLRLAIFMEETDQMLSKVRNYFISGGFIILFISALLVIPLSRKIRKNLDEVNRKAHQIARGDLSVKIEVDSHDELSELGRSLNEMATKFALYLQTLARERQDLNTVLSSIHEGIIAIDSGKKVIFFNDPAKLLLDKTTKDIIGKFYYQVVENRHLKSLLNKYFDKPFLISDELQVELNRTFEVVIGAFMIEGDERRGAVVVLRDISHYKKLEKIRRDFVANVTHEFKTPLAAIRGYSETLLDWALGDQNVNRKYVQKIIKQSNHLENLVTDLLQLARIERLQNLELIAFDPNPIIRDVLNEYSELAETNQLNLDTDLSSNSVKILGEPEMFRSIIANLVDNAIKYTPDGGRVLVASRVNKKHNIFSVKDTGIGIPAQEKERIFERFYRVDKARSRAIGGTGLGLSIVKHLTELQQGEVWVESELNKGSCFSVKFRLAKPTPSSQA